MTETPDLGRSTAFGDVTRAGRAANNVGLRKSVMTMFHVTFRSLANILHFTLRVSCDLHVARHETRSHDTFNDRTSNSAIEKKPTATSCLSPPISAAVPLAPSVGANTLLLSRRAIDS